MRVARYALLVSLDPRLDTVITVASTTVVST